MTFADHFSSRTANCCTEQRTVPTSRRSSGRAWVGILAVSLLSAAALGAAPVGARVLLPAAAPVSSAAEKATGETLIAVAANFAPAIEPLIRSFTARTGHRVAVGIGGTGSLYAQIVNGAPFEILLAADSERPRRLETDGAAVAGSRFTYAVGRLALWRPVHPGIAAVTPIRDASILTGSSFRHLAVADPTTAPYGRAARQVLERLGLAELLAERIVRGHNIGQTYQFVAGGAAEVGLVALSQVVDEDPATYWIVPGDLHQPITQQAVLLRPGRDNPAAAAFLDYLRSDEARRSLVNFGYALPER